MSDHDLTQCVKKIQNSEIKKFVEEILKKVPKYFWVIPASSTGKYHPGYALGEGGLIRHTRAAVQIALDLFRNDTIQNFKPVEKDIIIAALILHDSVKNGPGGKYTTADHGMLVEQLAKFDVEAADPNDPKAIIFKCVRSHMGQWNEDYRTNKVVAPKPVARIERFVHMCDYLASRKCLELNFDHAEV